MHHPQRTTPRQKVSRPLNDSGIGVMPPAYHKRMRGGRFECPAAALPGDTTGGEAGGQQGPAAQGGVLGTILAARPPSARVANQSRTV